MPTCPKAISLVTLSLNIFYKVDDFVNSALLVSPYCEGVDLNCGCPQGWACKEGIGACLIEKPEFLSDLVKQTRNRCRSDLAVSIKMRVHADLKRYFNVNPIINLWNTGLVTGYPPPPHPHPQKKHLEVFCRACFT